MEGLGVGRGSARWRGWGEGEKAAIGGGQVPMGRIGVGIGAGFLIMAGLLICVDLGTVYLYNTIYQLYRN